MPRLPELPQSPALHPRCPKCLEFVHLVGITTGPKGLNLRSFECSKCDEILTISSEISR